MWARIIRRICTGVQWLVGNIFETYACIFCSYKLQSHECFLGRVEKRNFWRTKNCGLFTCRYWSKNWYLENVQSCLLKTSVPRVEKLELLHEVFKVILSPLCETSFSVFGCVKRKGFKMHCRTSLAEFVAKLPERKDLSGRMYGCHPARPCCCFMCETRNVKDGRQYRPRCSQVAIKRKRIGEQVERDHEIAQRRKYQDRIA